MRRPIGYQELPKRFLFVVSPTIGMCCQEWTSLLRLQPELDRRVICGSRAIAIFNLVARP
jgi:hypothetical protein